MDTTPPPSASDEDQPADPRSQRYLRTFRSTSIQASSTNLSWGERLLPLIFVAMETCWVAAILIGLASAHFFGSSEPLIALWAPFLLMAGVILLASYLERYDEHTAAAPQASPPTPGKRQPLPHGARLFFGLLTIASLLVIWGSIYASTFALFDPRWLLALLNDALLLAPNAFHILLVLMLCAYFCWRGLSLTRRSIEPQNVLNGLRLGMVVIIIMIFVQAGAGGTYGGILLLLLIPLFLSCALLAHTLAKTIFVRRMHPNGLQGSVVAQERALLAVVGSICVLISLLGFVLGTFTSAETLVQVQRFLVPIGLLYDWLVNVVVTLLLFITAPIFWLLSFIHPVPQQLHLQSTSSLRGRFVPGPPPPALIITATAVRVLLPILVVVGICSLIVLLLRQRRTVLRRRGGSDLHESLWSWQLFLAQFKAVLLALWQRIFRRKQPTEQALNSSEETLSGEPMARSIREIYRALLRWSASRGYPRKKNETPYEFQHRLAERLPTLESELGTLTDAYASVRYGESVPDEAEVAQVQTQWRSLQQKTPNT